MSTFYIDDIQLYSYLEFIKPKQQHQNRQCLSKQLKLL